MLRRDFIKTSALSASALVLPFNLLSADKKIKLAILGTGWWGTDLILEHALTSGLFEIVALCDVNSLALQNASSKVEKAGQKKPQLFANYKAMYELKGLEAVAIATPTHWHALQFIDACDKGLHVFLEKPISYDIRESQAMKAAHTKAKNVVLVDFPRMMVDTNDKVKSFIQSGEAGKIYQVKANINNTESVLKEKSIPNNVDFEKFCGPAPKVKYLCNESGDTINWRGIHDLSRGIFADWGIHYVQNLRTVMDLGLPNSVSAIGGITKNVTHDTPDFLNVQFDFDGLPVLWEHKSWGYTSPNADRDIGVYYYGDKGTIFAGDLGWDFYPSKGEKISYGPIEFNPGNPEYAPKYNQMFQDMMSQFANGILSKSNAGITNTFEEGLKTTSCVTYADLAYLSGENVKINKENMDIIGNEKAASMLKRDYRSPYTHPYS